MNRKKSTYHIILALLLCMLIFNLEAQNVAVKTDRSSILIGERIQYELLIKIPHPGYRLRIDIPDRVPHFDIIYKSKVDTAKDNTGLSLHHRFTITSFDSGLWHFPSFPVILTINDTYRRYMTDSVQVAVGYSPADSTNQLRDIKPIIEVEKDNYLWYIITGICLLLLILAGIWYWYSKKRTRKPLPPLHSALSPYQEAMQNLEALSKYDLNDRETVKKYHTHLTEIIIKYYSRINDKNLLNKTTGDFLVVLNEEHVNKDVIASVASVLRINDAVKFAKYIPPVTETKDGARILKDAIDLLENRRTNNSK